MTLIDQRQAQAALEALGITRNPDDTQKHSVEFLIGSLLALTEAAAWQDIDRPALPVVQDGYASVLALLAGHDPRETARAWVLILNDRLNRTALELREATEGEGRIFVDVAGPAMLVASNMMNVLNTSTVDQKTLQQTIATAERNLASAHKAFDALKEALRGQGFQIA